MTFAFCGLSVVHAEQIDDAKLKFSVTIPDGFVRDPQLATARPDFVYAFRKAESDDVGVVIIIERMRGTIGREPIDMSATSPGFAGKVFTIPWHDFKVEAVEIPEEINGIQTVNFNVQVPLKAEAIQLRVLGRREQKPQLLQLTNALLNSLQGESNWLHSSAATPAALAQSPYYGWVIGTVCALFIIGGFIVLWMIRRVSRRGTVLGLAVLIYAASWLIGPGASRVMRGTVGMVRLLGFLGMLLGLYDLFRHPTKKPPAVPQPGIVGPQQ